MPPQAVAAAISERGVAPPPSRASELGRWESFKALSRQQWDPPDADERPLRRFAWVVAVGWHLLVAVALVWLMYQQYLAPTHPPRKGQEEVVQIEFIGQGAPEEIGGGADRMPTPAAQNAAPAMAAAQPEPAPATPPAPGQPEPVESPPAVATTVPRATAELDEPVAQPSPPEVSQTVEVSEAVPDVSEYQLPPPMPRLQPQQISIPDRSFAVPETAEIELPSRQAPTIPAIVARPIPEIAVDQTPAEVVVRDIASPLPAPPTVAVKQPTLSIAEQTLKPQAVREREIPAQVQASTAQPAQTATSDGSTAASSDQSKSPAQETASGAASDASAAAAQTAGPKTSAIPGGWSTAKRADDWGDSTRNVEGKQKGDPSGLFNSDGSVRLADKPGSASPARPPGAVTDEIVNLDRAGTWLKRAPTDYEPTAFDRYWRPSETLLEEWVRKSVTTVRIPIPGTNKHVVCKTILLVVGGACDITDPNLLDVPPTARPAPDIPFKPGLQEDNGSLPDPVG